jgi:hypothetical protein
MQDMVAVISLRFEDEISIDSLIEDLKSALNYPIDSDRMVRNLQHLRRSGLVSIDWQRRTIKREKPLKEHVKKNIVESEMWSTLAEDWRRINGAIQNKRGNVNAEYQVLLQKEK